MWSCGAGRASRGASSESPGSCRRSRSASTSARQDRFYYLVLAAVLLSVLLSHRIYQSSVGHALLAIRDDELAASLLGHQHDGAQGGGLRGRGGPGRAGRQPLRPLPDLHQPRELHERGVDPHRHDADRGRPREHPRRGGGRRPPGRAAGAPPGGQRVPAADLRAPPDRRGGVPAGRSGRAGGARAPAGAPGGGGAAGPRAPGRRRRRCSVSRTCGSGSVGWSLSTTSRSPSRGARCTGSSARTARARPRSSTPSRASPPSARGRLRLAEQDLAGLAPYRRSRAGIARTFQNIRAFAGMRAWETVEVGFHARLRRGALAHLLATPGARREAGAVRSQADALLRFVGLDGRQPSSWRATCPTGTSAGSRSPARSPPAPGFSSWTSRPPG